MKIGLIRNCGVLLLVAAGVSANAGTSDLIVRFRTPQNSAKTALRTATSSGVRADAMLYRQLQVLNAEEGVVRIPFLNSQEAQRARLMLERSANVSNITPNMLYKPAIIYRFNNVENRQIPTFLGIPFGALDTRPADGENPLPDTPKPIPSSNLPDVQLPPAQQNGADPMIGQDWMVKAIRLDKVADVPGNSNLTAAVIDTGIDYNHEDLSAAMWRKSDNDREVGYDFAHNHAKPFDVVHFDIDGCMKDFLCQIGFGTEKYLVNPGHGTHCAGHVAAVANNALGIRGVGAGVKVMALKFFYDYGEKNAGQGDDAGAIQAIDYAIKNGVKVISASWGGRLKRDVAEKSELRAALVRAQKAGVLFVAAAGNDTLDQDNDSTPGYPAAYDLDNIISVAAVDSKDVLADFSNYGAKSVHIAAPGVKIFSTVPGGNTYADVIGRYKDTLGKEQEVAWDGTSMAAPVVAGAAALVWSKYPNADYKEIRDRLLKSVRPVPGLQGKVSSGGVLDVATALR